MHDEQPGDREAAGAIEGMLEVYGAPAEPVTEPVPMDLLVLDPSELETEASGQSEAQRLRNWYEQEVGYDPVADDPSMTLDELRELCIGFAEEAGIASPVSAEG